MSEQAIPGSPLSAMGWGSESTVVICPRCDWRFLGKRGRMQQNCPHCHQGMLEEYAGDLNMLADFIKPPEIYLPFEVPVATLDAKLQAFSRSIPFAPTDLNLTNLKQRLRMIYIPLWLVDSDVEATWRAECAYPYQVKSHKEQLVGGRWTTQEVLETKLGWDQRAGSLKRSYQNVSAPALEAHASLMTALGNYDTQRAKPASAEILFRESGSLPAMVSIASRDKDDAWPDTTPRFQELASREARQACAAEDIREFAWDATYSNQNWSMFLLPVLSSYYLDDENKAQIVIANGQSGALSGSRRASLIQAKKAVRNRLIAAFVLLSIAILLGLLSLAVGGIGALAVIILFVAVIVGLSALQPIPAVQRINQT